MSSDDVRLERAILDSIWGRCQWDFLLQNPQLDAWLLVSKLEATDDPDLFRLIVASDAAAQWLGAHTFAIQRSLSVELKRPVEVQVVTGEAVRK